MKYFIVIIVAIFIVAFVSISLNSTENIEVIPVNETVSVKTLPELSTEGNQIIVKETKEAVVLRGGLSDLFRYGFNSRFDWAQGPDEAGSKGDGNITKFSSNEIDYELANLSLLSKNGANLIGLYLADNEKIKENIENLDRYIEEASDLGVYVYLLPVAHDYGSNPTNLQDDPGIEKDVNEDLIELTKLLVYRYGDLSNVIFGFGAEPMGETFEDWTDKQLALTELVRDLGSQNLIIITAPLYSETKEFVSKPFPADNIIYQCGGYVSRDDVSYLQQNGHFINNRIDDILCPELAKDGPVLIGEFGGNYRDNFSSDIDLSVYERVLKEIEKNNKSYTMYRMSPLYEDDKLSIFDEKGEITKKGQYFLDSLEKYPGTKFTIKEL